MFHPSGRLRGDFISAIQELIPQAIQPHQVAAAASPGTRIGKLAAKRKPSRQAQERRANQQLSKPDPKPY